MKFQIGWLKCHVDLPEEASVVAERLTSVGLAVEEVAGEDAAAVLDLEITTNRVDAMCHVGVARELAAAHGRELRLPSVDLSEDEATAADAASVRRSGRPATAERPAADKGSRLSRITRGASSETPAIVVP